MEKLLSELIVLTAIIYAIALPILFYFCWKYPLFRDRVRSMACHGWVYKYDGKPKDTEEELKKFAEWAGFKDTTPPTLFEEYEDGWCNPCPDMSDILHFFDKNGESLCRKWKRWAGIVEKNPNGKNFLCEKCVAEHEPIPTAP